MGLLDMLFGRDFDDPRPMTNQHLLSAIAGQADWLEKMSRAPIESQRSSSIVALASKRRIYIARLCLEVVSRADNDQDQLKYPGATKSINPFADAADYAATLSKSGLSNENAAVRAVKERLFAENGAHYFSSWES